MNPPRVSIVLPTLNGEADLERLLPALAAQVLEGAVELIAIDSGSQDRSCERLEAHGARVIHIERSAFRHGPARNTAAEEAHGEFLVFLSQDALPEGSRFLEALLEAFEDPRVAGAYSRVLPREGDDALTARTVLQAPEASQEPRVVGLDPERPLSELEPAERSRLCRFNNVASAIRRSVFERIPFPDLPFGEDVGWAAAALEAGHRIAFAPASVVRHAHRYGAGSAFERYRVDAAFQRRVHGHRVRPGLFSVLRGFGHELLADWRFLSNHAGPGRVRSFFRAPLLRGAQVLGQYFGSQGWRGRTGEEATRAFH